MAYFSNVTEGEDYQRHWCDKCVHDLNLNCPVWLAHLVYNNEQPAQSILDMLIPRGTNGIHNARCALFHPATPVEIGEAQHPKDDASKLAAWNAGRGIRA